MKTFLSVIVLLISTRSFALIEASYEVPVSDENLKVSAVFEMKKMHLEQNGNTLKMKYLIPQELTGDRNKVEFEGELIDGQGSLTYKDSTMDCLSDANTMMCKVSYQQLKFDQDRAVRMLTRKFQGEELQRRMMIQKDFSTDPVGIIKIKLK